jgi:hypothetical protein
MVLLETVVSFDQGGEPASAIGADQRIPTPLIRQGPPERHRQRGGGTEPQFFRLAATAPQVEPFAAQRYGHTGTGAEAFPFRVTKLNSAAGNNPAADTLPTADSRSSTDTVARRSTDIISAGAPDSTAYSPISMIFPGAEVVILFMGLRAVAGHPLRVRC